MGQSIGLRFFSNKFIGIELNHTKGKRVKKTTTLHKFIISIVLLEIPVYGVAGKFSFNSFEINELAIQKLSLLSSSISDFTELMMSASA